MDQVLVTLKSCLLLLTLWLHDGQVVSVDAHCHAAGPCIGLLSRLGHSAAQLLGLQSTCMSSLAWIKTARQVSLRRELPKTGTRFALAQAKTEIAGY